MRRESCPRSSSFTRTAASTRTSRTSAAAWPSKASLALAPDFLSALGGTPADEDKARDLFGKLKPGKVTADAVAAAGYLRKDARTNGKVGVVGFCWGGGIANQLAVHDRRTSAPRSPTMAMQPAAADVPKIKAKLMLHYAGLDERTNAGIARLRDGAEGGRRPVPGLHL